MGKKKSPALVPVSPRVLNTEQSASYIGTGVSKFNDMRKNGVFPVEPLPYGRYWDRHKIDDWLDEIGGIENIEKLHEKAWLEATHG
tara:strand:- start:240 stop:497 length:258 start_codon:yes stop_codon:yes gene_type:complete